MYSGRGTAYDCEDAAAAVREGGAKADFPRFQPPVSTGGRRVTADGAEAFA